MDLDIDHECMAEEDRVAILTVQQQICRTEVLGLEIKQTNHKTEQTNKPTHTHRKPSGEKR